jgi:formylglycine-generating enzyme required for sulfatase activity
MVSIPAGAFLMGSAGGRSDELPVHSVSRAAFEIDETEVTVDAYQACVAAGGCAAGVFVGAQGFHLPSWESSRRGRPFGAKDMTGNVREWTASTWTATYESAPPTEYQTFRSGSWCNTDPWYLRAAFRNYHSPYSSVASLGFRCAR